MMNFFNYVNFVLEDYVQVEVCPSLCHQLAGNKSIYGPLSLTLFNASHSITRKSKVGNDIIFLNGWSDVNEQKYEFCFTKLFVDIVLHFN